MPQSHRRSALPFFVLAFALVVTACKPKDGNAAAGGDASTSSATTAAAAAGGKRAAVPTDVCKLFSVADVSALLKEKVEAKDVPGGGCQFAGGTPKSLYPTISITEDFAGAGGIEGAKTGAQGVTGGVASPLTVSGASGYVVTGKVMGSTSTQAAVATKGLIVTVTVSGGEKAGNEKVVADLLKMALAKI